MRMKCNWKLAWHSYYSRKQWKASKPDVFISTKFQENVECCHASHTNTEININEAWQYLNNHTDTQTHDFPFIIDQHYFPQDKGTKQKSEKRK